MNFTQFLLILKARSLVALLALGVTVATTLVVSLLLPKSYTATNTLIVDSKAKDPVTGTLLPAQLMPGYMATQVDILQSQNVALKVVQGLKLADNPQVRADFQASNQGQGSVQHWLADLLLKKLEVTPSRESAVIQVAFSGSDPRFAAVVANAFAQAYINTNLELKVEPARQTSVWFESQVKGLRENLEKAQSKLSTYQREKGLIASDERIDVETARLAELSSQLVAAQSQTFDSASRQSQSGNALAEVEQNPLIQGLKRDLSTGETKLIELGQKVGKNHPQYQRAQAEVDSLRAELAAEMKTVTRSIGTTTKVAKGRESDIRNALAAQKSRVLSLKQQRDQASVLIREVENAQRVYDTALQRFNQSALESQNTQTDVVVLNPAVPPDEASSPKVLLNTILAIFLGSLLGIGLAFLMEMIDRRVRSSDDLAAALDIPVLGEIAKFKKSRGWLPFGRLSFGRPAV
ncbi:MAG: chain length determinant protein EpsF [Hydrogenophilales bacterium 28-61-23]|nr:MAG: chain length determinant protein EpsF [Hydrogenophilales bacterium 28-61-23]